MDKFISTPNILWKIEDFTSIHRKVSPSIKFMGLKFNLNFSKYLESGTVKFQIHLECQNASEAPSIWKFDIKCCVLSTTGERYLSKCEKFRITNIETLPNSSLIWSKTLSNITDRIGQRKDIIFLILITPSGDLEKVFTAEQSSEDVNEMTPCAASLCEDIGSLLNNNECSDFILKCGDRSFSVHKAVLSVRSHYFAGMFRSNMKEANENCCTIKEMDPNVLEVVLRYIYTGKLSHLSMDSLRKVSDAAGMFIIEPLKAKCLSLFTKIFTSEWEETSVKEIEGEQPEFDVPPRISETVESDKKKRQMLRNLFMTNEWRLFTETFPDEALEMYKVIHSP